MKARERFVLEETSEGDPLELRHHAYGLGGSDAGHRCGEGTAGPGRAEEPIGAALEESMKFNERFTFRILQRSKTTQR